jgi:hypothetical protein
MNNKKLYPILLISTLLLIDIYALYSLSKAKSEVRKVKEDAFLAHYALDSANNIENAILSSEVITQLDSLANKTFKVSTTAENNIDQIEFYFLYRGNDCTNCIVQTWEMLTELKKVKGDKIHSINSYFIQNGGAKLKPLLEFNNLDIPTKILDFNNWLAKASITTTPFLMVVDPNNKKVVDAYQPEPNNYVRRAAFQKKWETILENY